MSELFYKKLLQLIAEGREEEFYWTRTWKKKAHEVRILDRNECQHCKAKGKYRRGYIVHHVKPLRERPDLALSIWDPETEERQLVTICKDCHEAEHPESLKQFAPKNLPITEERWD